MINEENAKRTVISLTIGVELAYSVIKTIMGDDLAATLENAEMTNELLRSSIVTEFNNSISQEVRSC